MIKNIIFSALIACMTILAGCNWFTEKVDNVNAETYAKYAGKAVAVIVNTSNNFFTNADIKTVVVSTVNDVIEKLPTNIAYANVASNITTIVNDKVSSLNITDEAKKELIQTSIASVYSIVVKSLDLVASKYAKEFETIDKTYALVMTFLNSVKTGLESNLLTAENDEQFKTVFEEISKL